MQAGIAPIANRYGLGYRYGLPGSPLRELLVGVSLTFVGVSGLFSREGKYEGRSLTEMNSAYVASLLFGVVLAAVAIRRMLR